MLKRQHRSGLWLIVIVTAAPGTLEAVDGYGDMAGAAGRYAPAVAAEGRQTDVRVTASVGQRFDDNINYTRDDEQSDLITTLGAGVGVAYESKRTPIDVSAEVVQEVFLEHTEERNTAAYLGVRAKHELTEHETVTVANRFSHTAEPRTFEDEFERVGGRFDYTRNRLDIDYRRELTPRATVSAGYGYDVDNASGSGLLDSSVNRVSMENSYAINSKNAMFGRYEFLHRALEPVGATARVYTVSAGARHHFTEQLSLEARAGADIIDSYSGDRLVRPVWTATLTDQIDERTSADLLSFSQRYSTSPYTDDVFNSWRVSGAVHRQLRSRLQGSASAFYGRGKYVALGIREDLVGANAALSYELTKRMRATVSYTFSDATSNIGAREYRKNTLLVSLSTAF
jgi:hypothetical protein